MDRQGCAYFALDLVPQNLIFTYMTPYQKFILQNFMLAISARKTGVDFS